MQSPPFMFPDQNTVGGWKKYWTQYPDILLHNWMLLCMTYILWSGHSWITAALGDTVSNLLSWSYTDVTHFYDFSYGRHTWICANYRGGNFRMLCGVHHTVCLKMQNRNLNTETQTLRSLIGLALHPTTSLGLLVEVQLQSLSTFSTRLMWKVGVMARPL